MKPTAVAATILLGCYAPAFAAVTFDWAYVGNAGNAPNPRGGFGSVAYDYRISKHETTNAQYAEFLNAVDPTGANALALYNPNMAGNFGGIEATGVADGSRYVAQPGRERKPVIYITFLDAMRFTNWLHNGQGDGDTESGVYTVSDGLSEVRSAGATYWIPSEDEWYKAAYHDASAGTAGVYFNYATGSDSLPVSDQPGDNPAAVNYFNDDGFKNGFNDGYAVTGLVDFPSSTSPMTDVGAYTAAASPYGTFDQNGNVWEYNEKVPVLYHRGIRGGSWANLSNGMAAGNGQTHRPRNEVINVGFRVAAIIPEPSSAALTLLAAAGLTRRRPLGRDHRRTV